MRPDKVDEYIELVGNWYPRMASLEENKVHLVGSWRTEVGDCDTFGMQTPSLTLVLLIANEPSPHMGVPALPRLPPVSPLHLQTSRLRRI